MKFPKVHSLHEIANILHCEFVGDKDFPVHGMNEIHVVESGDIVFVDHPKYYDKALQSAATVVLINKNVDCPDGKALLISDDPFRDFNVLTKYFKPFQASNVSIAPSASIGFGTVIQPNTFIGNHVVIGKNCLIHSNVSIYDHTIIGDNVIIHAGTVLGADAFYYKKRPEGFDQLVSGGRVVIEDNVGIGALCTIDGRAARCRVDAVLRGCLANAAGISWTAGAQARITCAPLARRARGSGDPGRSRPSRRSAAGHRCGSRPDAKGEAASRRCRARDRRRPCSRTLRRFRSSEPNRGRSAPETSSPRPARLPARHPETGREATVATAGRSATGPRRAAVAGGGAPGR